MARQPASNLTSRLSPTNGLRSMADYARCGGDPSEAFAALPAHRRNRKAIPASMLTPFVETPRQVYKLPWQHLPNTHNLYACRHAGLLHAHSLRSTLPSGTAIDCSPRKDNPKASVHPTRPPTQPIHPPNLSPNPSARFIQLPERTQAPSSIPSPAFPAATNAKRIWRRLHAPLA